MESTLLAPIRTVAVSAAKVFRWQENFAVFLAFLLCFSHVYMDWGTNYFNFHPNFLLYVGTVLWAYAIRGKAVLYRTVVDTWFLIWVLLLVASNIYASSFMGRLFLKQDIDVAFITIFTCWAMYRAYIALTVVSPNKMPSVVAWAVLLTTASACVLAILQTFGPTQDLTSNLGAFLGRKDYAVMEVADQGSFRAHGPYPSPTVLGSNNVVGMMMLLALALGRRDRVPLWQMLVSIAMTALFVGGSITVQARFALVMIGLLAFFYILMCMYRRDYAMGIILTGLAVVTTVYTAGNLDERRYAYLMSVFEQGIQRDESAVVRSEAVRALGDLSGDLALLGSGYTVLSEYVTLRQGDYFSSANGPDSGYLQVFLNYGIPGVMHAIWFLAILFSSYLSLRRIRGDSLRLARWLLLMALAFMFFTSFVAQTHTLLIRGGFIYPFLAIGVGLFAVARQSSLPGVSAPVAARVG